MKWIGDHRRTFVMIWLNRPLLGDSIALMSAHHDDGGNEMRHIDDGLYACV